MKTLRCIVTPCLPWVVLLLAASDVNARVGGGQSYSGGGGGGSGGGGGGEALAGLIELLFQLLFWLNVEHPAVGIPVDLIVIGFIAFCIHAKQNSAPANASFSSRKATPPNEGAAAVENAIEGIRENDPNFSPILFTDFTYALYAAVHEARGRKDLATYASYLHPRVITALSNLGPPGLNRVLGVIVAGSRIIKVSDPHREQVVITVEFEANYTEETSSKNATTWYVREQWRFVRNRDVLSRPPDKITALNCPKCGGALERAADGSCRHCGVKIAGGAFDWYVIEVRVLERKDRGPTLTETMPEVGTDWPTVYQIDFAAKRERFLALNPDYHEEELTKRVQYIFVELQAAWSSLQWERARPFVSDSLFQMLNYWISEYRRQHLRNVLEDVHIETIEPVKVVLDAFHDALTFRVFASMRDYTVDEKGAVVCGDRSTPRRFSEYWTFIRRRGRKGPTHGNANCPNCGAPLNINMAGVCTYCNSKLTNGDFDWVLSRIEQDEAYTG
jgi:predicted lipid-binding transport protein (Tim44 family)